MRGPARPRIRARPRARQPRIYKRQPDHHELLPHRQPRPRPDREPMSTKSSERDRDMIQEHAESRGLTVREWTTTLDGETAILGRFRVIEEDEDNGLFQDDEGPLTAIVVGAREYGTERVSYGLTPDGCDSPNDVRDLDAVEEIYS